MVDNHFDCHIRLQIAFRLRQRIDERVFLVRVRQSFQRGRKKIQSARVAAERGIDAAQAFARFAGEKRLRQAFLRHLQKIAVTGVRERQRFALPRGQLPTRRDDQPRVGFRLQTSEPRADGGVLDRQCLRILQRFKVIEEKEDSVVELFHQQIAEKIGAVAVARRASQKTTELGGVVLVEREFQFAKFEIAPGLFGARAPRKDSETLRFQVEREFACERGLALTAWTRDEQLANLAVAQVLFVSAHLRAPPDKARGHTDVVERARDIARFHRRRRKIPIDERHLRIVRDEHRQAPLPQR